MKIQSHIPVQKDLKEQQKSQDGQFRKAAKLYEQQFLREMVKAMRKTVKPSGLIKQNFAEKLFTEQLDNEYVNGWSDRGGVGLAEMIYSQLNERFGSQNGMIAPPQGPIPIQGPSKTIKPPSEDGKDFILLDTPQLPESTQFIFQGPKSGFEVTSPWEGKVSQVFKMGEEGLSGRTAVSIEHDNGARSKVVFEGSALDLRPGDKVGAGDKIGQTQTGSSLLSWRVTNKG